MKQATKRAVGVLALMAGLIGNAYAAGPTDDVLKSFSKLQAHTETGINYRDYGSLVGDANFELQQYSAQPNASQTVVKELGEALGWYLVAKSIWDLSFGRSGSRHFYWTDPILKNCTITEEWRFEIPFGEVISCKWGHASENIANALRASVASQ